MTGQQRSGGRPVWIGDAVASLTVGGGLWIAWRGRSGLPPLAIATGFLLPLIVYRFSTFWNELPFCRKRALRLMMLMGGAFLAVHLPGVPDALKVATGFAAPLFVSWRARQGAGGDAAQISDRSPRETRPV